jgi:hypothetical protein
VPVKTTSAGRLLTTAGGRLRTCTCCTEGNYRRIFECCASCRFVFVPSAYLDLLGGEWAGTLLIAGKCYSGPEAIDRTREEIEAEFPDAQIFDAADIDDSPLDCAAARASSFCPPCLDCCITAYVAKKCFQGFAPAERPSVCCNWGRQFTLSWTRTVVDQVNYIYDRASGVIGLCTCSIPPGVGVVTNEDYFITRSCRVRRDGEGSECLGTCTYTTLISNCSGVGCTTPSFWAECGGITGTRSVPCTPLDPIIPGDVACQTLGPCNEYQQTRVPGFPFCFACGGETFRPDCDEAIIDSDYTCARNCFGGVRETRGQTRRFFTDFCYGRDCPLCGGCGKCECVEQYQCQMERSETRIDIAEWSVTIEDETGCEVDPCSEYNGGSDCPPAVTAPDDECSEEGGCPPIEEASPPPPAAPDAWSLI